MLAYGIFPLIKLAGFPTLLGSIEPRGASEAEMIICIMFAFVFFLLSIFALGDAHRSLKKNVQSARKNGKRDFRFSLLFMAGGLAFLALGTYMLLALLLVGVAYVAKIFWSTTRLYIAD